MPLPPRPFWSLHDASIRWECTPGHIIGLAHQGHFQLMISVTRAVSDGRQIAGVLGVPAGDLLQLAQAGWWEALPVHRVLDPEADEYVFVDEPAEGLSVTLRDLLISDEDFARFEVTNRLHGSRYVTPPATAEKYDWNEFYAAVVSRIHEEGVPETQTVLVAEMQEWFAKRSPTDVPDARTIGRRLTPIWRALQQQAGA